MDDKEGLFRIRANVVRGVYVWDWLEDGMSDHEIQVVVPKHVKVRKGDVWFASLLDTTIEKPELGEKKRRAAKKIAVLELVAIERELQRWETITELPDFWCPPEDLREILGLLDSGEGIIFWGDPGTGKTSLGTAIAEALGWQVPLKVDIGMVERTADLFGSESARDGTTKFQDSALAVYIGMAIEAHERGLDTMFPIILDEINRVHAKANTGWHGMFDDTRQVSFITSAGTKIVELPPNVRFFGTMNVGLAGTFPLDAALMSRFAPMEVREMPLDYEQRKLVKATGISPADALSIAKVARVLRRARSGLGLNYAPDFRACRRVARLVYRGFTVKEAMKSFFRWYAGNIEEPLTDRGKAYHAFTAQFPSGI